MIIICSVLILSLVPLSHGEARSWYIPDGPSKGIEIDDITLINSVAPFPSRWFLSEPQSERAQQLMDKYLLSISDWDDILLKEFKILPGSGNMGYYGDGRNVENAVRPICYAAFTNAFLSKINRSPAGSGISEDRRFLMKDHTIKTLRYLTHSHITGNGECAGWRQILTIQGPF